MLSLTEISPLPQADWNGRVDRRLGALYHPTSTCVQGLSSDSEIFGGGRHSQSQGEAPSSLVPMALFLARKQEPYLNQGFQEYCSVK